MKKPFRYLCESAAGLLFLASAHADSLWRDDASRSMAADRKAVAVGDMLTVIVQESSTATKDNSTTTSKKSSTDNAITTFLYSPAGSGFMTHNGQMPALKYSGQSDFSGGGSIENKEQIVAKITVRVADVLPNKNLVVEGTRHTSFGSEQQDIVLRGVVRPEDISANNTVFSYNIADATINIINKGAVTDSQRKGWFTRLWDKLMPF
jgi:flagellar L-ring protein precursor FlgH